MGLAGWRLLEPAIQYLRDDHDYHGRRNNDQYHEHDDNGLRLPMSRDDHFDDHHHADL